MTAPKVRLLTQRIVGLTTMYLTSQLDGRVVLTLSIAQTLESINLSHKIRIAKELDQTVLKARKFFFGLTADLVAQNAQRDAGITDDEYTMLCVITYAVLINDAMISLLAFIAGGDTNG